MDTGALSALQTGTRDDGEALAKMRPEAAPTETVRHANLDAIRGIACVLLVTFHAVGGPGSGLRLPQGHGIHLLMEWLAQVRMPIFAALSGYLFGLRPPKRGRLVLFIVGKLRRLGLPLLTATIIYAGTRSLAYDVQPMMAWLYSSYLHLWFLQASLTLLVSFGLWATFGRMRTGSLIGIGFVCAIGTERIPWIDIMSIGGALYLTPFFVFGIVAQRHSKAVRCFDGTTTALTIAGVVMSLTAIELYGLESPPIRSGLTLALSGCAAFALFLHFVPANPILSWVGRYSLPIFLWHALFGAAARIVGQAGGITAPMQLWAISFAAAILGSICLHRMALRTPIAALFIAGR